MGKPGTSLLQCAGCGAPLDISSATDGLCRCKFCAYTNVLPSDGQSDEVLSCLQIAQNELNNSEFERAYNAFQQASLLAPEESKAFFGMAIAANRVKFIKDTVNERWQPICFEISNKHFSDDVNYKRALELAKHEQRKEYERCAAEIDYIRTKFCELSENGAKYDTFICVKVSDGNGAFTQDSVWAGKLYDSIKRTGAVPFYSERDIGERVGEDYEALILYALYCAKSLVIVCSNEEYLRTPWVQNEYSRYYSMLADKEKAKNSIMIAFNGEIIERIPGIPGKIQGVNLASFDASQKVNEFVSKFAHPEDKKPMTKLCVNCGAECSVTVKFCPECASQEFAASRAELIKLRESADKPTSAEPLPVTEKPAPRVTKTSDKKPISEQKSKYIKIGAVVAVLLAIIVSVIAIAGSSGNTPDDNIADNVTNHPVVDIEPEVNYDEICEDFLLISDGGNSYSVSGYVGTTTDITIPSSYNGLPITAIKDGAFQNSEIQSVIIPDSVTAICASAFQNCKNLKSVTLGSGVEIIGTYAFYLCGKLEEVNFGNGLKDISNGAFRECSSLSKIIIPEKTENISDYAFAYCSALAEVTLPKSLATIGNDAFVGCAFTEITYLGDIEDWLNTSFYDDNNFEDAAIFFEYLNETEDLRYWYCFINGVVDITYFYTNESSVTIPSQICDYPVTGIANYACSGLTSTHITVPEGIESIGKSAFSDCANLEEITLPSTLQSIGEGAFRNCSSLRSVTVHEGVTVLPQEAFSSCESLTSMVLPKSLTEIGWWTLSGCLALSDVYYAGTAADWENVSKCEGSDIILENVTVHFEYIPDGVTSYSINYELNGGTNSKNNASVCVGGTSSKLFAPEKSHYKFSGWYTSAEFTGNALTETPADTLESITLYAKWEPVSYSITYVIPYNGTNNPGNPTAYTVESETVTLLDAQHSNEWYRFSGWYTDEKHYYPITEISTGSVGNITLYAGYTSNGLFSLSSTADDGWMINAVVKEHVPAVFEIPEYIDGKPVVSIWHDVFADCTQLVSLTLPSTLKTIDTAAFKNCTGLTSITIPSGMTEIKESAFEGCYRLVEVINKSTLPLALGSEENGHVAYYAKELHTGSTKIEKIGNYIFLRGSDGANLLVNYIGENSVLNLPDSFDGESYRIYQNAFKDMGRISTVTLSEKVSEIEACAFYGCNSLTLVRIAKSVTKIGADAFSGCTSLSSVYYNGTEGEWSDIEIDSSNTSFESVERHYESE